MATKSISGGLPAKKSSRSVLYYVRETLSRLGVTGLGLLALAIFLLPLGYVLSTSFKLDSQMTTVGAPVWPDGGGLGEYAGPLAGFITGLERCETPYMLTVPCDTPLFPNDLVERMAQAFADHDADFAVASAPEEDGQLKPQPVFCLMRTDMLESLVKFTQAGGRKIDAWTAQHKTVHVAFDLPSDDKRAFFNANTLAELHRLETPAAA